MNSRTLFFFESRRTVKFIPAYLATSFGTNQGSLMSEIPRSRNVVRDSESSLSRYRYKANRLMINHAVTTKVQEHL